MVLDASVRSEILRPFVPRLVIDWLREAPEANHRLVEGTLAFVDISGFTAMTERLARKGKVGAEEVNDVLDRCFTELLAVAYADGSGLVKWGGDAVLLLFQGDEHAARASRAAVGMRAALRRIGRLQTSAGQVTLRMSVGIHSGAFHFFMVGDRHRELVLTGPAATRTVEMESLASAGEIAISKETAAQLDPRVLGRELEGGMLLRRAPRAASVPNRESPDVATIDLEACLPPPIREHLLTGPVEPEHRHITAAFVQFGGTDELLEQAGPTEVADALDACIRSVQEAAYRNDVSFFETDIAHDGGKIMLIAGAPRSTGEEEERMLATARAIMDGARALPLRIGVNGGHVFAGEFGPPYRRTYSVKGDCVNLAARLMAKAERGQIIASREVVEAARTPVELVALEPFLVKGKSKPVHALAVGRPTRVASGRRASTRLPLIGRGREITVLREGLRSAREVGGVTVELVGEPGIGKSRLVEELVEEAHDMVVASAACELYESSTPYFPFRRLLRDLLGIPDWTSSALAAQRLQDRVAADLPHLIPWLPLLGIPLDVDLPATPETERLEERFRRQRLEEVTSELLGWILPTPTLLVFEDVHWMDEASSELLRRLASDLGDRPWMMCVTRRTRSASILPESVRSISLTVEPLPGREVAVLVSAATEEAPIPAHEMAALAERSGGNPLFLKELVAASRSAASFEVLPDSVEALVAAEIDRLAPPDRTLLRYASVLGPSFDSSLVDTALAGLVPSTGDQAWRRLADFVERGPSDSFHFRHALIRDAAYEGLPYRRRRDLHARVGETIEAAAGEEQAELLSFHFFLAQRFEKAWRYSRLAGDRAQAKYALVDAGNLFRRALDAAKNVPDIPARDIADVYEALGDMRDRVGVYEEAAVSYKRARRLVSGDPVVEAKLLLKEAWTAERVGRYQQALRWVSRGRRVLEGVDGDEANRQRARLSAWYAAIRQGQGRYREVLRWCRRAIEEAEASGDKDALAHAYFIMDWAYVDLGELDKATNSQRALELYEELGNLGTAATVLNNMGMFAYFRGRWDEAMDLYQRGHDTRLKIGDTVDAAMGTMNIGEILSDQGRLEEAEATFRDVFRVWVAAGRKEFIALTTSNLARVASRSGRHESALEMFDVALQMFEDMGDDGEALEVEARIAECLLFKGDREEALAKCQETLKRARSLGGVPPQIPLLYRIKGLALLQSGSPAEAREAFEESLAAARFRQAAYEVALSLRALGDLARVTGEPVDEEADRESRSILDRLGVVTIPDLPLPVPR
jgi:class 3 adenylate cyclase/tetratricopeptide (TPR) repeat protein